MSKVWSKMKEVLRNSSFFALLAVLMMSGFTLNPTSAQGAVKPFKVTESAVKKAVNNKVFDLWINGDDKRVRLKAYKISEVKIGEPVISGKTAKVNAKISLRYHNGLARVEYALAYKYKKGKWKLSKAKVGEYYKGVIDDVDGIYISYSTGTCYDSDYLDQIAKEYGRSLTDKEILELETARNEDMLYWDAWIRGEKGWATCY